MYPLKHTPLHRLFPRLCCCIKLCQQNSNFMRSISFRKVDASEAQDELDFDDDNQRLDDIATKYGAGSYQGTNFIDDCMEKYEKQDDALSKAKDENHDPMEAYGYGVVAYFTLL